MVQGESAKADDAPMSISIIWTSNRLGGMDVLFHSLERQNFDLNQVEVILVDEFFDERYPTLIGKFKELSPRPAQLIHVPPDERHDYIDDTHGYNTGLRRASGELIMFMTDHIWLELNCLRLHWETYRNFSGYSATGLLDRFSFPKLKASGEDFTWSAFAEEFTADLADRWFEKNEPYYKERKGAIIESDDHIYELPGGKFYAALNESIPMSVLREVNGWDEIYNGGYAVNDIDLGTRANMAGWKFLLIPKSINKKFGGHGISDVIPTKRKIKLRTSEDNYAMWQREMKRIGAGERTYKSLEGCWR